MTLHTICYPFAGDIMSGGGHFSALSLIRHLDRQLFQPLIAIHGDTSGSAARMLKRSGALFEVLEQQYVRGHGFADLVQGFRTCLPLTRFLRRHHVRIVHVNDVHMLGTWVLASRITRTPLLWHHRSPWHRTNVLDRLERQVSHLAANRIVSVSRFAAPRGGSAKCTIITDPFDTDRPAPDRAACRMRLLDELGLAPDTCVLGLFANLRPRKRPFVFLDTVSSIRRQAPALPVVALYFGHVPDDLGPVIKDRAHELGIADRVHFMGFRQPPEPWLAACDVLLAPAISEGFGRTLVEAMLVGTPVVASDTGGHRESIRDGVTGLLAPVDDPEAFASRVLFLLNDRLAIQNLTVSARSDAKIRFGAERHAEAVMSIYRSMLALSPVEAPP